MANMAVVASQERSIKSVNTTSWLTKRKKGGLLPDQAAVTFSWHIGAIQTPPLHIVPSPVKWIALKHILVAPDKGAVSWMR